MQLKNKKKLLYSCQTDLFFNEMINSVVIFSYNISLWDMLWINIP